MDFCRTTNQKRTAPGRISLTSVAFQTIALVLVVTTTANFFFLQELSSFDTPHGDPIESFIPHHDNHSTIKPIEGRAKASEGKHPRNNDVIEEGSNHNNNIGYPKKVVFSTIEDFPLASSWMEAYAVKLPPTDNNLDRNTKPDYDDLKFGKYNGTFYDRYDNEEEDMDNKVVHRDRPDKREAKLPDEDEGDCRPGAWVHLKFSACNTMHESTFAHDFYDYKYVGEGTFRQTYIFNQEGGDAFAFKPLIYKPRKAKDQYSDFLPYEALILERLTASPRIMDIYAYCGTTSILESMPQEANELIVPEDDSREVIFYPSRNNLTSVEKVNMSLRMAESLADIHGFEGSVIVHGDNHIDQFLINSQGVMKMGDFNLASILKYAEEEGEYCKHERPAWRNKANIPGASKYYSPEEIMGKPFDEKVDIYTLGNSIYSTVTGYHPFPDFGGSRIVENIKRGYHSYIDSRYEDNPIEAKLLDIVDLCWTHNPEERVDIFTVVAMLRNISSSIAGSEA